MHCPKFVDFLRECQYEIGILPLDTREFCATRNYRKCPFYKMLHNVGYFCQYLKLCPSFEHFKADNFNSFVKIANGYCLSKENNSKCARYKIRIKGQNPPSNLMPDGSYLESWFSYHKKGGIYELDIVWTDSIVNGNIFFCFPDG